MKISSKNLFVRYYNWIYGDLPKDICSFFWGSVFAILLAFISVPGRLIGYFAANGSFKNGFIFWLCYFACLCAGLIPMQLFLGVEDEELALLGAWGFLVLPIAGAAFIVVIFGAIIGFVRLLVFVVVGGENVKIPESATQWIGAIRRKHCTKIEWK